MPMGFLNRQQADRPALTAGLLAELRAYIDARYEEDRPWAGAVGAAPPLCAPQSGQRRGAGFPGMAKHAAAREERAAEDAQAKELCDTCLPESAAASAYLPELEGILRGSEITFSEYLLDLLRERGGRDSEVYRRAEVSRQLFSKILSNRDYQPTKSTAVQLAIGLQLDLNQTQKLLEKAGFALTRSSKADLVVRYCIEHGIYSVTFINEALYDCGLPLLKTGLRGQG